MNLPDLRNFDLKDKRILLRVDYDVPLIGQETRLDSRQARQGKRAREQEREVADGTRIDNSFETINYLLSRQTKIILLSHAGRPDRKVVNELSLEPIATYLSSALKLNKTKNDDGWSFGENIVLKENLRFNSGEENNDLEFTKKLAGLGDFYINDSFAVTHREHASIVGLPKLLPHAAGLHLLHEVEYLSRVLENPLRPVVVILGGVKEDKLNYVKPFLRFSDKILIGGNLPRFVKNIEEGLIVAQLTLDGSDISEESITVFEKEILNAKTIVLAGPMGKFENENSRNGTERVVKMISESSAFKIAGGGETEEAISVFKLNNKFDWISSGGGAMLDFLADGDLVGLKALRDFDLLTV